MLEAFIARYNGVLARSLEPPARTRALAGEDVVHGLSEALVLAAVAQTSHYPPATADAPSLEVLTDGLCGRDRAQR